MFNDIYNHNVNNDLGDDTYVIEGFDWLKSLGLYVGLQIGRIVMIVVLYYPIKMLGDGLNVKEAVMLIWGALRGALALALALIVYVTNCYEDNGKLVACGTITS